MARYDNLRIAGLVAVLLTIGIAGLAPQDPKVAVTIMLLAVVIGIAIVVISRWSKT